LRKRSVSRRSLSNSATGRGMQVPHGFRLRPLRGGEGTHPPYHSKFLWIYW
jgi:hypothetical protein